MRPTSWRVGWTEAAGDLPAMWHQRHPRLFTGLEVLVSVWLIFLGAFLCAIGNWRGALLFVPAELLMWTTYSSRSRGPTTGGGPRGAAG